MASAASCQVRPATAGAAGKASVAGSASTRATGTASVTTGVAGSKAAAIAAGTSHHSAYATCAPNTLRSGRRNASTGTMAALPARVTPINPCSSS